VAHMATTAMVRHCFDAIICRLVTSFIASFLLTSSSFHFCPCPFRLRSPFKILFHLQV
jgi:hypothetical protein